MTRQEILKDVQEREKRGISIGLPLGRFKRNKGNGKNKNYNPQLAGYSPASTHLTRAENEKGKLAVIPITSRLFDRSWTEYHSLDPDERKIRRMKNKQRKLLRGRKNRRQHGRSTRVAS